MEITENIVARLLQWRKREDYIEMLDRWDGCCYEHPFTAERGEDNGDGSARQTPDGLKTTGLRGTDKSVQEQ